MARFQSITVPLSHDPQDKRCACMNHDWLPSEYEMAPDYFDPCARWYSALTPTQKETVGDVISFNDRPELLPPLLADLPAAPKFLTEAADKWPKRDVSGAPPATSIRRGATSR